MTFLALGVVLSVSANQSTTANDNMSNPLAELSHEA
jgi:hypothetical protein